MSDTTNSAGPPPEPALISAPTSVARAVHNAVGNGAVIRLNFSSARSLVEIGRRRFDEATRFIGGVRRAHVDVLLRRRTRLNQSLTALERRLG